MKAKPTAISKAKMLLTALLITVLASVCAPGIRTQAATVSNIQDQGFTVTYDNNTKTLYINGTGDLPDYTKKTHAHSGCGKSDTLHIVIGEGITSIGDYLFYGEEDYDLVSVTLPSTLKSIGDYAFYGSEALTSINLPEGLTEIGESALQYSKLSAVTLPSTLETIGPKAFCNCYALTSISMPSSLKSIGEKAFCMDKSLKSVTLPSGLTYLGNAVFSQCTSLSGSIVIPDGVTSIRQYAFYETSITSITIPKTVTSISKNAFENCDNLKKVNYGGTKKQWAKLTSSISSSSPLMKATLATSSGSLDTCKVKKLTNKTSGIAIKWNKVSGASGYYVYRKTGSGSYKKIATIKKASTVTYTDKSVKNKTGTEYTYKVVAYKGSTKSSFTAKTITRKK